MKRVLIFLVAIAIAAYVYGQPKIVEIPNAIAGIMLLGNGASPGGTTTTTTASQTYMTRWNGDHASGNYWADLTNGTSSNEGTAGGSPTVDPAYGQSGDGVQLQNDNESIYWTDDLANMISQTAGTVWMSVYYPDDFVTATAYVGETGVDSSNFYAFALRGATKYIRFASSCGGSANSFTGNDAMSEDAWNRIAFSWDYTNGDVAVKVGANDWDENTSYAFGTWAGSISSVAIGERNYGGASTITYWVDNVYITSGYKDLDPSQ